MAEQHPIKEELTLRELAIALAQLWDQVWWMQLPDEQRQDYERQGFTAPIRAFYHEDDT